MRWATPVIHFRRTATEDTELGGQKIKAGEKVVHVVQLGQPRRAVFDEPVRVRRHAASRSRPRSASAPAARTSASAPTWPAARSR